MGPVWQNPMQKSLQTAYLKDKEVQVANIWVTTGKTQPKQVTISAALPLAHDHGIITCLQFCINLFLCLQCQ